MSVTDLAVLPAGSFESRARVTHHLSDAGLDWPDPVIEYPAATLRHYEGPVTCGTHSLLYTPSSILPDAFRWPHFRNPSNPRTINASTNFARIPAEVKASKVLPGHYYPLDPGHPGFGHVMTETMSRLWGWDQAKAEIPDLKAILHVNRGRGPRVNQVKYRILRAYGIPADDIVWAKKTVRLDSVVSATAMWHNNHPYYVRPDLQAVWHRLGERLIDREAPTYDKIFVARSARYGRRACRNAEQVETLFAAHGFTIYYPENFDLAEQAAVFSAARVIAGYGGSGLFNILFARRLETTIILNQDAYYHRNEHLFTSVIGGDVHYYWSRADLPQDESGQDRAASRSDWEFDFDRHGADIANLLTSL